MKKNSLVGILISILIGIFVFFVGIDVKSEKEPVLVYRVYLNGETIGIINSEEELLDLIDERQKQIKEKYKVDKVYPPKGLDIKKAYTYNSSEIISADNIYQKIQNQDPFTISGYTVTINYPKQENDDGILIETKDPVYINVLKKSDFEDAFKSVIKAFVGTEGYELFSTDTQPEIIEVGSNIEIIEWDESISIKENFISANSYIYDNASDISKYLLFGSLDEQDSYEIKVGDDIKTVAYNHNLSSEEFLVANPEFTSANVLLTPGKNVNVSLIKPVVTISSLMHVVEDIVYRYKTEYVDDKDAYYGSEKVIQEGADGITRVTEKVLYKNGEIQNLLIDKEQSVELIPVTNKIISRGVKNYSGSGFHYYTGSSWLWPAVNPSQVTSEFGPRWGSFHNGIDISGSGFGSPIYSSTDGTVIDVYSSCPSSGYGIFDNCGSGYGNKIEIATSDGKFNIIYAHLIKDIKVKVGDSVSRGQVIGSMGHSGRSTGTHLHFEIIDNQLEKNLNPCSATFFNC
ncbi:MAG: peptidoglycan DD-metalloendopeptidase family protein [Bacilli bacterium]|nr:peptidoglycan DD-metalloendopeptidase family protein [Bacilli bacterium]